MELKSGSFAKVIIKNKCIVDKVQDLYEKDGLSLTTLSDAAVSSFVSKSACKSLPSMFGVVLSSKDVKISMPYYGEPLNYWALTTSRRNKLRLLPYLVFQLVDACDWLLKHNIQHTDIKPTNILIDKKSKLTLIDYNIYSIKSINGWVQNVCTWCYAPPEILFDEQPETNSMVWSIGMIISEICCGYPRGEMKSLVKDINDRKEWKTFMLKERSKFVDGLSLLESQRSIVPPFFVHMFDLCTRWDHRQRPTMSELVCIIQKTFKFERPTYLQSFQTVTPSKNEQRNESISMMAGFCTSFEPFQCLLYRSIWLMDIFDRHDTLSLAACVMLTYIIYGFTASDMFLDGLNKYICTDKQRTVYEIEERMLSICTTLEWEIYDQSADVLAMDMGVTKDDVVSHIPKVMSSVDQPYTGLSIAHELYKATLKHDYLANERSS